jgi:hypothetical protein
MTSTAPNSLSATGPHSVPWSQTGIAARCTAAVNDRPAINDELSAAPEPVS